MNILFVCTGNTCRSPMAEAIMEAMVRDSSPNKDIKVKSAGITAIDGLSATQEAIMAMNKMGLDLSSHKSQRLTWELYQWADLILTMTDSHKNRIIDAYRSKSHDEVLNKVATISSFAGTEGDINDPIGRTVEIYEECAQHLKMLILEIYSRL